MSWWDYRFYGSTLLEWFVALAITIGLAVTLRYVHQALIQRLRSFTRNTVTRLDDFASEVLAHTRFLFFVVVSLYVGAQYLALPPKAERAVGAVAIVAFLIQFALWGHCAITFWIGHILQSRRGTDGAGIVTVSALGFTVRLVLWSMVALMVLENLGVNVTALVASLGIGGIAVALAVQNILGDIFASLSITLDKPFVVGDFIVAGDTAGEVEHVGLKTTRLRSVSGEQIVLPNADLLKSRIHNYKRMTERRVQFWIGLAPETPADTLERIPAMVRAIVEAHPAARFERAHFKEFGEHTLNVEIVYFMRDPDYNRYMDIQQAINLALLRRLSDENVALGHPRREPQVSLVPPAQRASAAH